MSFEPFMIATFCDDVRQEVGNKLSYLGIYGANLIVPAFPTTLIKLCCVLTVRVPASAAPKRITFRLTRDDEVLFDADATRDEFKPSPAESFEAEGEIRTVTVTTIAQLVNFPITQRCLLRAHALVDGKELRGGSLELETVNYPVASH